MGSLLIGRSPEGDRSSLVFTDEVGDQYLTQRILRDLRQDPPAPLDSLQSEYTTPVLRNAAYQDTPLASKPGPNPAGVTPVSKQRRSVDKAPAGVALDRSVKPIATGEPKVREVGGATSASGMTSAKSTMSAKSRRQVVPGALEASASSAISDARFAAAHDVFGDSYAPTLSTLVALPDARRVSGGSDGESVTSPLAREEPPAVFAKVHRRGTAVTKVGVDKTDLRSKDSKEVKTGSLTKEGSRKCGSRSNGLKEVKSGFEAKEVPRRRSSSGSTASELTLKRTAVPSLSSKRQVPKNPQGERPEYGGQKGSGRLRPALESTESSDAASVSSCNDGESKWGDGTTEGLITGLTCKLQKLECELSKSKAELSEAKAELNEAKAKLSESRICEAEMQRQVSLRDEQLAAMQERLSETEGLQMEARKREEELVEMAGFVRRLQERVRELEQENQALGQEERERFRGEKGQGTDDLVRKAEGAERFRHGVSDGVDAVVKPGSLPAAERRPGLVIQPNGVTTRDEGESSAENPKQGELVGTSGAGSRKETTDKTERLRKEVQGLRQQLEEMTAFLADYGLTWVGKAGAINPTAFLEQSALGSASREKRPENGNEDGHWKPCESWAPGSASTSGEWAVKDKEASQKIYAHIPSVSVPSWLAAHLEEHNENGASLEVSHGPVSSPHPPISKPTDPKAQAPKPANPKASIAKAWNGAPPKLSLSSQDHHSSNPAADKYAFEAVQIPRVKRDDPDSCLDVGALRQAIDGLNALATEGGATIVTSPGGREHRLQEPASIPLTIYANGIRLGNGTEFRPAGSPAARALLADILDGFFPYELKGDHPDGVPLRLVDRSAERFVFPFKPFRGEKRVLVSRKDVKEQNGTEISRERNGVRTSEDHRAESQGATGDCIIDAAPEATGGERLKSRSKSSARTKPQVEETESVEAKLTSLQTECTGAEPFPTSTSNALFRSNRSAEDGRNSILSPPPVSREEFLDRLPKRVIRGGKLIDVRGEIAQLLRPSGRARESERARAPDARRTDQKANASVAAGSLLLTSDDGSVGKKGAESARRGHETEERQESKLQSEASEAAGAARAAVRLKVRGLEGLAWVVELPVDATVAQLYQDVEKLRRKSKAGGKYGAPSSPFSLSTTFPTTPLSDKSATLSSLGIEQDTVLILTRHS